MVSSGATCVRFCVSNRSVWVSVDVMRTILAGLMLSSPGRDFSLYTPLSWRANPDEETTNWRAVRGRTAPGEGASPSRPLS